MLDVTSLAHPADPGTESTRVAALLAQAFRDDAAGPVFICWNDSIQRFVEIPAHHADPRQAARSCRRFDGDRDAPAIPLSAGCTLVVPGDAWARNDRYVRGLEEAKQATGCSLHAIVHDLAPLEVPLLVRPGRCRAVPGRFLRLAAISDGS